METKLNIWNNEFADLKIMSFFNKEDGVDTICFLGRKTVSGTDD